MGVPLYVSFYIPFGDIHLCIVYIYRILYYIIISTSLIAHLLAASCLGARALLRGARRKRATGAARGRLGRLRPAGHAAVGDHRGEVDVPRELPTEARHLGGWRLGGALCQCFKGEMRDLGAERGVKWLRSR